MGCYTNLGLPTRVNLLEEYIRDYRADGFMINSVKSCNSFSVGQLLMLRQLEERTGVPGGFIESDLVDPRYFSAANIKNRIESYLQMIDQKRSARIPA
jgi:benzoyl-CoA reductase subunit B